MGYCLIRVASAAKAMPGAYDVSEKDSRATKGIKRRFAAIGALDYLIAKN